MSTEIVSYSLSDGIATVLMDDGRANALSTEMIAALEAALDRAEGEAKALVLAGREGKFCAGFDLRAMMAGPEAARALVSLGGSLLLRLYEFPMPVVMACTGHALAGGALLAATGDTRIGASGSFKIGLNEVQNGMPVPILAHELARDRLLPTELFAAVVQAKIYDPEGAKRAGWLDRLTAPELVLPEAQTEAARLAKLPRGAYAASKRSLRRATLEHVRATLESNLHELLQTPLSM
ncbi:MAG: crotonase/enoyl-CoA hydratase family protein [Myxococcales bacterium]|nr:crotonase/enoyl-CoA hydratase family protein [Myxococcales bacterium]